MATAGIGGTGSAGLFRQNYVLVSHSDSFVTPDFSYTFFLYLLEDDASRSKKQVRIRHVSPHDIIRNSMYLQEAERES